MKTFVFLTGSSSVGKTTLQQCFQPFYTVTRKTELDKIEVPVHSIGMSFREVRARIGNPTWEELEADHRMGMYQQNYGMQVYEDRILQSAHEDVEGILLFERNPLDIIGYSTAFGLPDTHIKSLKDQALKIFQILTTMHKVIFVYRPVDWSFPYDRQNNARPGEAVRRRCDSSINKQLDIYRALLMPNLQITSSVNHGSEEVDRIIKMVVDGYQ